MRRMELLSESTQVSPPSPSQDDIPQSTQPTLVYTFLLLAQPPLHDRSPPQGEATGSRLFLIPGCDRGTQYHKLVVTILSSSPHRSPLTMAPDLCQTRVQPVHLTYLSYLLRPTR